MNSNHDIVEEDVSRPAGSSGLAFATGFFFSARIATSLFSVRLLGTEPSTGAGISLTLNLILLMLVCFHSLGPGSRTLKSLFRLPSVRWVSAFLIFSGCSLAWSATVSLPTSIVYWCGLAADVGIVLLLFRTGPAQEEAHALMKGFIWSTCCLALVAWVMPTQLDLRLGDETYFNTNQIGNLCAFTIFLAQYLSRRKEGKWGFAIFFLAVTLLRSLSKTTIVAFVLSESVLVIQDRSMSRRTKGFLTAGVVLVILIFWGLFEAYYNVYTSAGNQAETLTGRTGIWAYVLNEAVQRPWIGYGFDSMWKIIPPFGADQFEPRHAENEILQQFYTYGVAGLVLLAGLYGSLYRKLRKLQTGPLRMIFSSILLFIVIRGLAEAEAFDLLLPLWMIVLISVLVDHEETATAETVIARSPVQPDPSYPSQPASLSLE